MRAEIQITAQGFSSQGRASTKSVCPQAQRPQRHLHRAGAWLKVCLPGQFGAEHIKGSGVKITNTTCAEMKTSLSRLSGSSLRPDNQIRFFLLQQQHILYINALINMKLIDLIYKHSNIFYFTEKN